MFCTLDQKMKRQGLLPRWVAKAHASTLIVIGDNDLFVLKVPNHFGQKA